MNDSFNKNELESQDLEKQKKKIKRIYKLICTVFLIAVFLRSCGPNIFSIVKFGKMYFEIMPIQEELEILYELDITKDDFDRPVVTSGEIGELEWAMKEYIKENSNVFKDITNIIDTGDYLTIYPFKSFDEDDLLDTLNIIDHTKEELANRFSKLNDENERKLASSLLDESKLNNDYVSIYYDGIEYINESKIAVEKEKLEERINKTNEYLDNVRGILALLINNPDAWHTGDNKLIFRDIDIENEYYILNEKIE